MNTNNFPREKLAAILADGTKVRVTHLRQCAIPDPNGKDSGETAQIPAYIARKLGWRILPQGGMTVVEIGKGIGLTRVHPRDNFNRKLGVRIAASRAIQDFDRLVARVHQKEGQ